MAAGSGQPAFTPVDIGLRRQRRVRAAAVHSRLETAGGEGIEVRLEQSTRLAARPQGEPDPLALAAGAAARGRFARIGGRGGARARRWTPGRVRAKVDRAFVNDSALAEDRNEIALLPERRR